jgi:hypothetical protein
MAGKTLVFTSAALNYIPKVRMLFRSLRELHPEFELHLALSDALPADVDLTAEPFDEVHPIDSLDIPQWEGWAFCHNIVELSTAIKPFLLEKLLQREDCARVFYFDPDMVAFSRVDDLIEALGHANIILTPHQVEPESRLSAVIDNEICSLKHGIYNLGFIGVAASAEGLRFANWWKQRLYHFCRADIPNGLFTDQRWIDLVPAFFEHVAVIRSPRHNVAPWNATTRMIKGDFNDGFKVNGDSLGFYHFTGFDSGAHRIMAAKNAPAGSDIHKLVEWYAHETAKLSTDPLSQFKWAFGSYSNGKKIPLEHRLIYRERVDLQRAFVNPFVSDATHSFAEWIESQGMKEYPGLTAQVPDAGLDQLKRQLTPGFRLKNDEPFDWGRMRGLAAEVLSDSDRAKRVAKRAWQIIRSEGLAGIGRRLS